MLQVKSFCNGKIRYCNIAELTEEHVEVPFKTQLLKQKYERLASAPEKMFSQIVK